MVYTTYLSSPVGLLRISCDGNALNEVAFADGETLPTDEHPLLHQCLTQLNEYFEGSRRVFDLPLAQKGTEFQIKIWELLCDIPYGKTMSYNELAKKYGDVKAIRACASANGKNHLAILVPCHRVIGSNQTLVGYAGGLPRKKWLLEHEAQHSGMLTLF